MRLLRKVHDKTQTKLNLQHERIIQRKKERIQERIDLQNAYINEAEKRKNQYMPYSIPKVRLYEKMSQDYLEKTELPYLNEREQILKERKESLQTNFLDIKRHEEDYLNNQFSNPHNRSMTAVSSRSDAIEITPNKFRRKILQEK